MRYFYVQIKKFSKSSLCLFQNKLLYVVLSDGRQIATPLSWYTKLSNATVEELKNWEISPSGVGIHWPDLDEDLSIRPMLSEVVLDNEAA